MRKENRLEHGLYYVERSGDEYHKISGDGCEDWSRANDEESRILSALLREAKKILNRAADRTTHDSTPNSSWGRAEAVDLTECMFGLYYITADGSELYDLFEGTHVLPNLWGAELIAAQTLVHYAVSKLCGYASGGFITSGYSGYISSINQNWAPVVGPICVTLK